MNIYIDEIVKTVNKRLKEGLSTAQIEKEMGVGKDSLRKRLNRANYRYNKALKQYRLIGNTDVASNVITPNNTSVSHKNKTKIISDVTTLNIKPVIQPKTELTEEEINILKTIARNYKKINRSCDIKGEVVTRSVRTYNDVLEQFASYCKENKISQKESIALALIDFMES